jgi:hypothetical protein
VGREEGEGGDWGIARLRGLDRVWPGSLFCLTFFSHLTESKATHSDLRAGQAKGRAQEQSEAGKT